MFGPVLRGKGLSLEPPRLDNLALYCGWFADVDVTRYMLVRFPASLQQEEEWYTSMARSTSDVVWNIVVDGEIIGNTGIHSIDWISRHGSTGSVIGNRSMWGKGYGSESVRLRTAYAFEELGLERLESESFADNVAMHRALEKSGYRKFATRSHYVYRGGRWHDCYLFEVLREEWAAHNDIIP